MSTASSSSSPTTPPAQVLRCKCGPQATTEGLPASGDVELFLGAISRSYCPRCQAPISVRASGAPHLQLVTSR